MLSTLAKRPSVREGRVPWDVRWVRTKLRKLRKSEDSGAAEKAGEVPENRNSVTNTGQCPSMVPPNSENSESPKTPEQRRRAAHSNRSCGGLEPGVPMVK